MNVLVRAALSEQHRLFVSQFAIWDDKNGKNKPPTKQDKSSIFFFGDDTTLSLWEGCVLSSELNTETREPRRSVIWAHCSRLKSPQL